jgi:hypothetical protein
MNENNSQVNWFSRRFERNLAILAILVILATTLFYTFYPAAIGAKQPIPFSHHLHNDVKNISCVFCHDTVLANEKAGIPPLERCMLCHSKIIVYYPPIHDILQSHYNAGQSIEWVKVNDLPDFVFFHHGIHIAAGIDCGQCHGDVRKMDRVVVQHKFEMGFCIKCHRQKNASIDCFNCHH